MKKTLLQLLTVSAVAASVLLPLNAAPAAAQSAKSPADSRITNLAPGMNGNDFAAGHVSDRGRLMLTQQELVSRIAQLTEKKPLVIQQWLTNYEPDARVRSGEAARLGFKAIAHIPSEHAAVTDIKVLSAATLEITFDSPLTAADVNLDKAKANFQFDNGMTIRNVPQLKNGARSTYVVPVTVQQPGKTYRLTYKGKAAGKFTGTAHTVKLAAARQVTADTFELESLRKDGVVDYGYVVESYFGTRGGLEMYLNDRNASGGKSYDIISSLRDMSVTLTPEGGQPIRAAYVPYTQATDDRQAPKFRLPAGQTLTPGVKYTVTADWATVTEASFTARAAAPLVIASAKAVSGAAVDITLAADPRDELFSGRSVELTAVYKVTSRKGAVGTFELAAGAKLSPGKSYTVTASGAWATQQGKISLNTDALKSS
ncbi:hypothetical protein P4H65_23520 [Paenibacillus chitinolyticus]|uniref:hypothetical protein n=1 Tax=Paenibacillus chitinolyticus TaxID=79263 RepID=UPI002DBFEA4A|nr:hypothetical protein [Paenibacillus chitinolyticus]MEC0248765.1 hypothetical protein [Paenibacillus chitinolyticus]